MVVLVACVCVSAQTTSAAGPHLFTIKEVQLAFARAGISLSQAITVGKRSVALAVDGSVGRRLGFDPTVFVFRSVAEAALAAPLIQTRHDGRVRRRIGNVVVVVTPHGGTTHTTGPPLAMPARVMAALAFLIPRHKEHGRGHAKDRARKRGVGRSAVRPAATPDSGGFLRIQVLADSAMSAG